MSTTFRKPNYQKPNTDVDGNGFDLHHPVIWHYHVPKGTVIIRFGNEYGRFLSTEDACFDNLAIGLDIHSIPYRKYLVTTDDFYVTKGVVGDQSNFGIHGKGGAIQYMAEKTSYFFNNNEIQNIFRRLLRENIPEFEDA